ncbi:1-acyl-sn-glycerol-3-phosphate acyltransferase [candidate division WOR-3 bacterium]|nr:1-acyl-sn-glycerol-3-phosphate acyltransferase [candidate division WOR-3 bacterium]
MQFHIFISVIITFLFMKIAMGLRVEGQKNIPRDGGVIIAPNHLSNWDPPIIGTSAALRREVFFLAKQELFSSNKFYSLLLSKYNTIPIKRYGIDKKSISASTFHLKRGRTLVIFLEGKRSIEKSFLKPLPGVGYLALKTGVGIVPTYIEGSAESIIDLIRRRKRVLVRFGKIIDVSKLNTKGSLPERSRALSKLVMKEIMSLGKRCLR